MLNIVVAQLNPTVADFKGNVEAIGRAMEFAAQQQADLLVCPELSLSGYYPGDLLEETSFLAAADQAMQQVLSLSQTRPGLHLVVGAIRHRQGPGKPLANGLVVLKAGQIVAEYHKQLLPTYGIFDERRHFEPGPAQACCLSIAGHKLGFLICEDGWNDSGRDYQANPWDTLAQAQPELVISINASPANLGKREQRHDLFSAAAKRHQLDIVYVNQVGGQDQLVFDGASFAVSAEQGVVLEASAYQSEIACWNWQERRFSLLATADNQAQKTYPGSAEAQMRAQIVLGLRDYARRCGFKKLVIGSSGGIDSALCLALAAEALGPEAVTAITMPSAWSSTGSVDDSVELCQNLGIRLLTHPIASLVEEHSRLYQLSHQTTLQGLALENLQARIRGTILMAHSNSENALLLTTGNKSEISVGYCTLYGDTNGGLGLIGDLYKTEVYALSRYLNQSAGYALIPAAIIEKAPSAELAPGQFDSDSLPDYAILDEILKWHIEGQRLPLADYQHALALVQRLQQEPAGAAVVQRVLQLVARNEYKRRQAAPIIRVRNRAFGSGRQMPIAANYAY